MAVLVFTMHFCPYLLGRHLQLCTDHGSLSWLRSFKEPVGQLVRWLERLQGFDFYIVDRQGKFHTNADAISRISCKQCRRVSEIPRTVAVVIIILPKSQACKLSLRCPIGRPGTGTSPSCQGS